MIREEFESDARCSWKRQQLGANRIEQTMFTEHQDTITKILPTRYLHQATARTPPRYTSRYTVLQLEDLLAVCKRFFGRFVVYLVPPLHSASLENSTLLKIFRKVIRTAFDEHDRHIEHRSDALQNQLLMHLQSDCFSGNALA